MKKPPSTYSPRLSEFSGSGRQWFVQSDKARDYILAAIRDGRCKTEADVEECAEAFGETVHWTGPPLVKEPALVQEDFEIDVSPNEPTELEKALKAEIHDYLVSQFSHEHEHLDPDLILPLIDLLLNRLNF